MLNLYSFVGKYCFVLAQMYIESWVQVSEPCLSRVLLIENRCVSD